MKVILLSKKNIDLAKEEIISLTKTDYELIDNLLITKTNIELENRLGYSHSIYKFLFRCPKAELNKNLMDYDWNKIYIKNFCVRVHNSDYSEKKIADIIYDKIKNPVVNLSNPITKFEFFFYGDIVIACLFIANIDKSYLKRRAHLRPSLHPTSLHPRLARCLINLTGLTTGKILDPFCGSGGILIEAGLMGFKIIGYDTDIEQLNRAKKNLDFYNIKYKLENKDALTINKKVDAIITDLPYGRGSKISNINNVYQEFLLKAYNCAKLMIIVFPDFVNYHNIINKSKWKIKNKFESYVHKSLTRIIVKLVHH